MASWYRKAERPPRRVAFRQHREYSVECFPGKLAVGPGFAHPFQQGAGIPFARADLGDQLLRQHVQRRLGNAHPIQQSPADGMQQGHALDQVVAGNREQAAFRRFPHGMTGPPHPLDKGRYAAWRADLADQVDVADIDSELQ